jgi:hypothetical protein
MRRALILTVAALAGCGGDRDARDDAGRTTGDRAATTGQAVAVNPGGQNPGERTAPLEPRGQGGAAPLPPAPQARARWAIARPTRRVALRARPGGRAVGRIGPRTQFGGPRVVSVLRRSGAWLEVVVPERPNARPAWIRAGRTRLGATDVSLRVDRSDRTLTVRRRDRVVQRVRIGVGAPEHPTPTGRFAVTDKLEMSGPGTTYGCCAIALSAHQPHTPATWNGLDRIAVHGTQSPETIGVAASLGCMHASDGDLRRLMRTVPLGAPVFIRA